MGHSQMPKLACNRLGCGITRRSHTQNCNGVDFHPQNKDLEHLLGDHPMTEEGMAILREWKKFMLHESALYHCHTPAGELEEAMQFIVPMAHRVAAMNGCHRDAGHQ